MPTDKRERQRAGREARRIAAREAQRKAARRRQIITFAVLILAVVGVGLAISFTGGDDDADLATVTPTTPTTATTVPGPPLPCPAADGSSAKTTSFPAPPPVCIDGVTEYSAQVETDKGTFTIGLTARAAPKTVNSFVYLARYHAYDGVPFHRVIPGFVVQGGDVQNGDGSGGPCYETDVETVQAGSYQVGSVAMAKKSGSNTNGSQFFVVTGDQGAALPLEYSLFGNVTQGLEVVKAIEADGSADGAPKVRHVINKVTILEKKE